MATNFFFTKGKGKQFKSLISRTSHGYFCFSENLDVSRDNIFAYSWGFSVKKCGKEKFMRPIISGRAGNDGPFLP